MAPEQRIILGLLGAIGSGKTTVARIFAELGAEVLEADQIVHDHLNSAAIRKRVVEGLGADFSAEDPFFRQRVAEIVFSDPEARRRLEGILHPLVTGEISNRIQEWKKQPASVLVLDVPLLVEAGLDSLCDSLVFVKAPREVRIDRVRKARGWEPGGLKSREKWQLPEDQKRPLSDFTIDNGNGLEHTRSQVEHVWEMISY